jgi:hypothetical protein
LSATAGPSLTVIWARNRVTDTSRRHEENQATLRTCSFACCRNDGSRWTTGRHPDRHDGPPNEPLQQPGARVARSRPLTATFAAQAEGPTPGLPVAVDVVMDVAGAMHRGWRVPLSPPLVGPERPKV